MKKYTFLNLISIVCLFIDSALKQKTLELKSLVYCSEYY